MSQLCITLPPFAPDYSGACSALFDFNGLFVIHDASGCTGNYTGYDEPRWYHSHKAVFCSGLRELDAVLGQDDRLIDKITAACQRLQPDFLALLGSPVPMVIGTDFEGIAAELEHITGLPAFGFPTTGLYYYNHGVAQVELALAKRFILDDGKKEPRGVNLLGLTPLDFSINSNVSDLCEFLEKAQWKVVANYTMKTSLEAVKQSAKASLNLVVSQAGLPLAQYMEKNYGIPYVAGLPLGTSGRKPLLQIMEQVLEEKKSFAAGCQKGGNKLLFIGEQIQGNAVRMALEAIYGEGLVTVGCLFHKEDALACQGDLDLKNEKQIRQAVNGSFSGIIGDPLLKQLLAPDRDTAFYPFVHTAVSSKLYPEKPVFLSEGTERFLRSISIT